VRGKKAVFLALIMLATLLQPVLAIDDYGEDEAYLGQVVDDYLNEDYVQAKNNVIRNATLDCMELEYLSGSIPIPENFTDGNWVEWGANIGRLSQTDSRSIHTDLEQVHEAVLVIDKDYDGNYYKDFIHNFTFCITDIGGAVTANRYNTWAIGNYTNDQRWFIINGKDLLVLAILGTVDNIYIFRIFEWDGSVYNYDTVETFTEDVVYYVGIVKSGLSFICEFYTDALYQNLKDSISITLHSEYVMRYLHVPQSFDYLTANDRISGYVEDLYIGRGTPDWGYEDGHYYTEEMLAGNRSLALLYNASIPGGTGMTMEFSSDNATWVDHNKARGSDRLLTGYESLDLRDLNFTALYTRVNMTTTGGGTPALYQFRLVTIVNYTMPEGNGGPSPEAENMGKYYAMAIILLILGVLIGLGMRGKR